MDVISKATLVAFWLGPTASKHALQIWFEAITTAALALALVLALVLALALALVLALIAPILVMSQKSTTMLVRPLQQR